MTTQEILAECDMRGLTVIVMRVMGAGEPLAWSATIGDMSKKGGRGPSFAAALISAWRAYDQQVAA